MGRIKYNNSSRSCVPVSKMGEILKHAVRRQSPELTDDEDQGGDSYSDSNSLKNRIGYPAKKPKYSPGALSVGAHNNIFPFGTSTPYSMKRQDFEALRAGQSRFSRMETSGMNSENRNPNIANIMGKTQFRPMSLFGDNPRIPALSSLGQQNHKRLNFGQLKSSRTFYPTHIPTSNSSPEESNEEVNIDGENDNIYPMKNKSSTYKLDKGTTKTVGNRFDKKTPAKKSQGISEVSCSASWWASLFTDNKLDSTKTAAKLKEKQCYKSMVEQVQNNQFAECARQPWMSDLVGQRTSSSRLMKSSAPLHPAFNTATGTIAEIPVLRKEKKETIIPIVRTNEPHDLVKELFKTFDASVSDDELDTPPPSTSNKLAQRKETPYLHLPSSVVNSKHRPISQSHSRIRAHEDTPRRVGYCRNSGHSGQSLQPGVNVRSKSTESEEETFVISQGEGVIEFELESDSSRTLPSRHRSDLNTGETTTPKTDLKNDVDKRMREQLTLTEITLLEPGEPQLPEITENMQLEIDRALKNRNPNEVLANGINIQVTRGDLKTLARSEWLNDNVIDTYMDMIADRSRSAKGKFPSVHVFTKFFYPKFLKEGYSNVLKRWTREVDIFSFDLLMFPIHSGNHWCLAVADLRRKTISCYDSLLGNQTMCVNILLEYLSFEMRERKKTELNSKEWKLEIATNIPSQKNENDCGVFTCKFAEYLSRDSEVTFKPENMVYYRHRMIYEIIRQNILFP